MTNEGEPVDMPLDPARTPGPRCRSRMLTGRVAVSAMAAMLIGIQPVLADLKVCNASGGRIGLSLGYQDRKGWVTEGWWNISSQTCEVLLKGGVPSRFIYVYAVDYDRGGEWAGTNYMCTREKSFAIRGVEECQTRGFKRTGFFEVDTGDSREWTIRLTDPEDTKVR
jgi:uncharacterized membrane protein